MATYFIQDHGKLKEFNNLDWINTHNTYRYSNYTYNLEITPICNICNSELVFQKKGKYLNIIECSNLDCITHKNYKDIRLRAFLPNNIYENIINNRKKIPSCFDKNYLMTVKQMTSDEADEYIQKHKELLSNKMKGHNAEYYKNKYGEQEYIKKQRESNYLCIEYWLKRGYSEEDGKKEISKIQSNNSKCVKHRCKISYENNKLDNPELFFKQRSQFSIEYWLKRGYSEEEGQQKISELQRKNSLRCSNKKKQNPEQYKDINSNQIGYWLKQGYSKDEAMEKVKERQSTFTLEKCIQKYGEIEGRKRFEERQKKWQNTLHDNGNMTVGYSKISQDLFNVLLNFYEDDLKDYIFYGSKNREYIIRHNGINYLYDFVDLNQRKIIEFNGVVYHAKPTLYKENDIPIKFKGNYLTAKDIWEKDKIKANIAIENKFDILIIWEDEYKNNIEETIIKCKKFLNLL